MEAGRDTRRLSGRGPRPLARVCAAIEAPGGQQTWIHGTLPFECGSVWLQLNFNVGWVVLAVKEKWQVMHKLNYTHAY